MPIEKFVFSKFFILLLEEEDMKCGITSKKMKLGILCIIAFLPKYIAVLTY